jgi:hypothetical protein
VAGRRDRVALQAVEDSDPRIAADRMDSQNRAVGQLLLSIDIDRTGEANDAGPARPVDAFKLLNFVARLEIELQVDHSAHSPDDGAPAAPVFGNVTRA